MAWLISSKPSQAPLRVDELILWVKPESSCQPVFQAPGRTFNLTGGAVTVEVVVDEAGADALALGPGPAAAGCGRTRARKLACGEVLLNHPPLSPLVQGR
jgi:hypothetical protein